MADAEYSNEVWNTIPSAPNYEVSDHGRVRRSAPGRNTTVGRILSQCQRKSGSKYRAVTIQSEAGEKLVYVHRLVAEAFLPPQPSDSHVLAHNDGDGANNVPSNLRWATQAENIADKFIHDTHQRGERHGQSKLKVEQVREIRASASTCVVLAAQYGVTPTMIWTIKARRRWAWLD